MSQAKSEADHPTMGEVGGEKKLYGHLEFYQITNDNNKVQTTEVMQKITSIGREHHFQIRLHDPQISRKQCELVIKEIAGKYRVFVKNLSNRKSTVVSGRMLEVDEEAELLDTSSEFTIAGRRAVWKPLPFLSELVQEVPEQRENTSGDGLLQDQDLQHSSSETLNEVEDIEKGLQLLDVSDKEKLDASLSSTMSEKKTPRRKVKYIEPERNESNNAVPDSGTSSRKRKSDETESVEPDVAPIKKRGRPAKENDHKPSDSDKSSIKKSPKKKVAKPKIVETIVEKNGDSKDIPVRRRLRKNDSQDSEVETGTTKLKEQKKEKLEKPIETKESTPTVSKKRGRKPKIEKQKPATKPSKKNEADLEDKLSQRAVVELEDISLLESDHEEIKSKTKSVSKRPPGKGTTEKPKVGSKKNTMVAVLNDKTPEVDVSIKVASRTTRNTVKSTPEKKINPTKAKGQKKSKTGADLDQNGDDSVSQRHTRREKPKIETNKDQNDDESESDADAPEDLVSQKRGRRTKPIKISPDNESSNELASQKRGRRAKPIDPNTDNESAAAELVPQRRGRRAKPISNVDNDNDSIVTQILTKRGRRAKPTNEINDDDNESELDTQKRGQGAKAKRIRKNAVEDSESSTQESQELPSTSRRGRRPKPIQKSRENESDDKVGENGVSQNKTTLSKPKPVEKNEEKENAIPLEKKKAVTKKKAVDQDPPALEEEAADIEIKNKKTVPKKRGAKTTVEPEHKKKKIVPASKEPVVEVPVTGRVTRNRGKH